MAVCLSLCVGLTAGCTVPLTPWQLGQTLQEPSVTLNWKGERKWIII